MTDHGEQPTSLQRSPKHCLMAFEPHPLAPLSSQQKHGFYRIMQQKKREVCFENRFGRIEVRYHTSRFFSDNTFTALRSNRAPPVSRWNASSIFFFVRCSCAEEDSVPSSSARQLSAHGMSRRDSATDAFGFQARYHLSFSHNLFTFCFCFCFCCGSSKCVSLDLNC
jgi:hypothetical protein